MIHVAILGSGAIAGTHIDAFAQFPEYCKVTAVCNWHVEKAEKLIREKNLTAVACASLEDALACAQIDAVSICLPPALHATVTEQAAERGLHILVEKPMANSLEECDRMIAAAEKHGVVLSSICQMRFTTRFHRLHELLEKETCGKLRYASANSFWWRGDHYHDVYWRGRWEEEGGGVLTAQAIHHLDLLLYCMGMPSQVTAVIGNLDHNNTQCEDVATAILVYPDKFAQFSASLVAHGEGFDIQFFTEEGRLSDPWRPAANRAMPNGYPENAPETVEKIEAAYQAIPPLETEHHAGQILNFLRAICGEEALVSDGREGRKVIELITAIYESACLQRPVQLPLRPDDPFYTTAGKAARMPHFHEKTVSVDSMGDGAIVLVGGQT